jgi:ubiquinone/menaquinone biosynthesis C-methylase UbiE
MAFITYLDFVDLWHKLRERGTHYAAKKLFSSAEGRVKSTWDEDDLPSSNWWQVDQVRARWNKLITGNEQLSYPDYVVQKYTQSKSNLNLLSIGCGTGQRELEFAKHACFSRIEAIDIAPKAIADAQKTAAELGITNCCFEVRNVYQTHWNTHSFDVVLFHSSLHHFKDIDNLLDRVKQVLKPGGLLIINEYVGASRFQFSTQRKKVVREIYEKQVPTSFKTRKNTTVTKHNVYFPGYLRMVISDPSEAVESAEIMPLLNKKFTLLEQKNYGGNVLTFILKDIAHHFNKPEATAVLTKLFELEDELMKHEQQSDFVFAVYQNQL